MGTNAFENCKNLESIVLPKSLKTLGRGAFKGCEALKSVELPTSINLTDLETFSYCYKLESINVSSVRVIDNYAFAECDALTDIMWAMS